MTIFNAILVLGPTGVGKTPLGEYIEENGLGATRCCHFDFGEHLRSAHAASAEYPFLSAEESAVIDRVLGTGALLEDHQFGIVEKLFSDFTKRKNMTPSDWVLLNGMPRHVGQALKVRQFADVKFVLYLVCSDTLVYRRIVTNVGGDRADRVDDDIAAVKNKLEIFKTWTLPLVAHYQRLGARLIEVEVGLSTSPREIVSHLPAF